MNTKPTPEEYKAACAVVKRMQNVVREKFILTLKGQEALSTKIIDMPEIGCKVVKFQTLLTDPLGNEGDPFFRYGPSRQLSFPSTWMEMSVDQIKEVLQEQERVEKEKDLRLNEERLAMVLEAGGKVEIDEKRDGRRVVWYSKDSYIFVDELYIQDSGHLNWLLVHIKSYAKKRAEDQQKKEREDLAQLAAPKEKYPKA